MQFIKRLLGQGAVDHNAFAKLAIDALVRAGVSRDAVFYEERSFALRYGDSTSYLANAYMKFLRAEGKAERARLLDDWVHSLVVESREAYPATFQEAREHLMPVLRSAEEVWYPAMRGSAKASFVDRPFPDPDLVVSIAYDRATSLSRIPEAQLAAWGVSAEAAWDAAMHNLRLRSADAWERVTPGLLYSTWGDAYDASRVLLPDVVHRTGVGGKPYVMVPTRDRLVVAGEHDPGGLEKLVSMGLSFYDEDPYTRSPLPLQYDGDRLVVAALPPDLAVEVGRRIATSRAQLYRAQADANAEDYGDVFFANLLVFAAEGGAPIGSVATWSNGVDTLLPKAGLLSFVIGEGDVFQVRWNDALDVLGALEEDPDLRPVRYRVREFPSAERLERLRARAVTLRSLGEPVCI